MPIFKGAGVAIVTPMKSNFEVNYDKLEELINFQIDNGTDAIIIAGTTGESSTLSMEEHREVIKAAVKFTKGRVPVVAGTGSNATATAIQLTKEAEEDGAPHNIRFRSSPAGTYSPQAAEGSQRAGHPGRASCQSCRSNRTGLSDNRRSPPRGT